MSRSQLSISTDGRASLDAIAAQARIAEQHGARTFWLACHLYMRDPITMANVVLAATTRMRVALMAMSPYSMHPVYIAMAAATLNEAYPGRVVLSLGVGAPGDLAAAGIDAPRPIATMREAIALCRALLAGETVRHAGQVFRANGRRLANGPQQVPIVLAASGPQMLELAGAKADGVLISAATSPAFIQWCIGEAERGAQGRRFETLALVYTRLAEDAAAARDGIRRTMGFILRGKHHAKNLEVTGTRLDQATLYEAYSIADWPTVERLITNDVINVHAAVGTANDIKARYAAYLAIGLDEVIIGGIDETASVERVLQAVATSA
jgi:5,10-methylenetetrahydromethanopterin reductase